jgi:putative tryptophan/tyrosine transport system substrate-binding protein
MGRSTANILKKGLICVIAAVSFLSVLEGCKSRIKTYKMGIAANSQRDGLVLEGLRAGMAELGYLEGENLEYIIKDFIIEDEEKIDTQVKELLAQDMDIVFVIGKAGDSVRKLASGTDLPVLFAGDNDPVGHGLVKSLSRPGGNQTGVMDVNCLSKSIELLKNIKPGIKKIWMPYDPNDQFLVKDAPLVEKTAQSLNVSIIRHEVHSIDETIAAINNMPGDVDAIFIIPSQILFPGMSQISKAAINRGIPTGSPLQSDDSILIVLTTDFYDSGKRAARLAHQMFAGVKPSDIPVETPESQLTINLKTAEKIGVTVPNGILAQAKRIIR